MRNALSTISSLDAGSKHRLKVFRSNLMKDQDERHYDGVVCELLKEYCRPQWKPELTKTIRYLRYLKSSKDGKFFSQGVKEYRKLLDAGKAFSGENYTYFGWNVHYQTAKKEMMDEFSSLNLSPLKYYDDDSMREALPKLDTHSGFTYLETGRKEKRDNLEHIFERFCEFLREAIGNGSFYRPILPAVRTQGNGHAFNEDGTFTGDCDHKTRMVSMIDLLVIFAELLFSRPIQDYMAGTKWYAGGKDLDTGIAAIISNMRTDYGHWVSLDYSSFDQSISAWLIHDAFDIIHSAFKGLTDDEEAVFRIVEHDFIEKDFIFGDEIIHSVKGVPSGSMFTQIIDSIVNRLVISTYLCARKIRGLMIIMGDDNLVYTVVILDIRDLASYVKKNFGMTINADKTKSGLSYQHPEFLSCTWMHEGRFREPHVLIAKLLYPERTRRYDDGSTKPEQVIWAYILGYRLGMDKFFDIDRLMGDYPDLMCLPLRNMGSQYLPGFMKYLVNYTEGYWSGRRDVA